MKFSKQFLYILGFAIFLSAAFLIEQQFTAKVSSETPAKKALYQCPMHPHIISDKPGKCPICGMNLVPIDHQTTTHAGVEGHATISITPERQQLIGMRTAVAEERLLTSTIHAAGHVAYNPDVSDALAEYSEATRAYWRAKRIGTDVAKEWRDGLMELADLRLRLAGFSEEQMGLIKTLSSGRSVLINDKFIPKNLTLPENSVWIVTDIYESDSKLVELGQHAHVAIPALSNLEFDGEVKAVDPVLNAMIRIIRLRIEVPNAEKLQPGMSADVQIEVPLGKKLAIPGEAVLNTGQHQLIFVVKDNGQIEPREVKTGDQADDYLEILSGLNSGEKVVAQGGFLIDSESRIRAAAQSFIPTQEKSEGEREPVTSQAPHVH